MKMKKNVRKATTQHQLYPLISALVLCLLMLAGCAQGGKNMRDMLKQEDLPGGRKDRTDSDAPKVIDSKELVSFKYEGGMLGYQVCHFSLVRKENGALCSGWGWEHWGDPNDFEFEFMAELSTLDALQAVIDEHDLARYNGISITVNGLPPYGGERLFVNYASGENISAYDNNFHFMYEDARLSLFKFFHALAEDAGYNFPHLETWNVEFEKFLLGCWQDRDETVRLDFRYDSVKIHADGQLTDDTTFYIEYDRLYNAQSEDGSFSRYAYIKRFGSALYAYDSSGVKTTFYRCPDVGIEATNPDNAQEGD